MDRRFGEILSLARKNKLKNVLEIGSIRNPQWEYGDGHATRHWISFFEKVYSYDIDPNCTALTKQICGNSENLTAETKDGIQAIEEFNDSIDLLYLDAWDVVAGTDYREKHLIAFMKAEDKLHEKSLVLIDDTHHVGGGKGELVIPYALGRGWYAEQFGTQTLLRKKLPVVFIISTFDKEDYFQYNLNIIRSYKYIDPKIVSIYNGQRNDFVADTKLPNDGHSVGHYPQIMAGYKIWQERYPEIKKGINLCVDDWLCDEQKILEIFQKMEDSKAAYAGNYWFNEAPESLATEIFFVDLKFGDFLKVWNTREPNIEASLYNTIKENKIPYIIISERAPIHWENRFICEKLKWTMDHDLNKNIENARRFGVKI